MAQLLTGSTINGNIIWHNGNFALSNIQGFKSGTVAARPAATNSQVLYISYDTGNISYDNGSWTTVGGLATMPWTSITGRPTTVATSGLTDALSTVTFGNWHKDANPPSGVTQLNYDGYLYATRVYNAVYNDYAEYYIKDDMTLEPGDIVAMNPDGDGFIKSQRYADDLVVGVFSDDYGHCIGGKGNGTDEELCASVGQAGRVRVKVIGPAKKGQFIIASEIPGVGVAVSKSVDGTVVGKVLENKTSNEISRISAQIMLK